MWYHIHSLFFGALLLSGYSECLKDGASELFSEWTDPESVSVFIKTSKPVRHMQEDAHTPGNIIFTDDVSIRTTDGDNITVIAGSSRADYQEGTGTGAGFNYLRGFTQISGTMQIAAADKNNNLIRMILYDTGITSIYAGTASRGYGSQSRYGSRDGAQARFYGPYDVIQDKLNPKRLIVSEYDGNAIRAIDRDTRITTTLASVDKPRYMTQTKEGDIFLTAGHGIYRHIYNQQNIIKLVAGSSAISGYYDLGLEMSRFLNPYGIMQLQGIDTEIFVIADQGNNHLRVVDLNQSRTMTLNLCRYGAYKFPSWGLLSVCNLSRPEDLLLTGSTLYLAESDGIKKFEVKEPSNQTYITQSSLHVNSLTCEDQELNITVQPGMQTAQIEITPYFVLNLAPGNHSYFTIQDGRSCIVQVKVFEGERIVQCPRNITTVVSLETGLAAVEFISADGSPVELQLPPGIYPMNPPNGPSENNCSNTSVKIYDATLRRRLVFTAKYDVKCEDVTGGAAQASIEAVVVHNFRLIEEICQKDCKGHNSGSASDLISCSNDTLTVNWPTDRLYYGNASTIPHNLEGKLVDRLRAKGSTLMIVLYNMVPRIIYPMLTEDGTYASLMLVSSCIADNKGNMYTYDVKSDTCTLQNQINGSEIMPHNQESKPATVSRVARRTLKKPKMRLCYDVEPN